MFFCEYLKNDSLQNCAVNQKFVLHLFGSDVTKLAKTFKVLKLFWILNLSFA